MVSRPETHQRPSGHVAQGSHGLIARGATLWPGMRVVGGGGYIVCSVRGCWFVVQDDAQHKRQPSHARFLLTRTLDACVRVHVCVCMCVYMCMCVCAMCKNITCRVSQVHRPAVLLVPRSPSHARAGVRPADARPSKMQSWFDSWTAELWAVPSSQFACPSRQIPLNR